MLACVCMCIFLHRFFFNWSNARVVQTCNIFDLLRDPGLLVFILRVFLFEVIKMFSGDGGYFVADP